MNWSTRRLDDLGTVSRGRSRWRPRNDPSLYGGPYPFIQTADVKNADLYISNHSQTYNDHGLAQSKLWPKDTLCITIAANIADTALLSYEACFPDSIIGFIADPAECDVRYVKYFFDLMQTSYRQISQGAAQDNLSQRKLLSISIPSPPVVIQRRIAEILTAYGDLIENNNRRIALMEEAIHRLYLEWFVYQRFPGFKHVTIVDGVPEGWEKRPLADVCSTLNDGDWIELKDQGGSDYRLLQVSNIGVGVFVETGKYRYITQETFDRLNCREVHTGNILVSRMPKPIGRAWLVTEMPWRMITAVDVAIIEVDGRNIDSHFLTSQINHPGFIQLAEKHATGATRPRISKRNLSRLPILVPSEDLRNKFGEIATESYKFQNLLRNQNMVLREARESLLPRLMNGSLVV